MSMTTRTQTSPKLVDVKLGITLLIIFCTVLFIRLWFLGRIQSDPVFRSPVFDPKEFNFWAFQIMHRQWTWHSLQNHTPLYAYFLAIIYKLFGFHVNVVAVIQSFLGALSACLMYVLVKRVVNPVAATVCVVLMASYWWFIYTQLYLFSENLAMFLNIVLIFYLTFAQDSLRKFIVAGMLLGLSVLCRPDILGFALCIGWWIARRIVDRRRRGVFYGVFLTGLLIVLAPVLIRNHQVSGSWLLRKQIGANFYIGNNPDFLGTNVFLEQGRIWQKFITMPYTEMRPGRELRESEINAYYFRKTRLYIQEHPLKWMTFMCQKVFTIMTGREFIRSEDVYFRDLFVRHTPFVIFSTPIILILACAGFFLSWASREKLLLVGMFLLSLFPAVFFPSKTRYLVPILPFVMVFASLTVSALYQAIREKDQPQRVRIYLLLLCAYLLFLLNPLHLREPDVAETYYAVASNLQYQGNYPLAEKYFQAAVAVNPLNCSAWIDMGILYIWTGDYQKAQYCFGRGRVIDPAYSQYYEIVRAMIERKQSGVVPEFFLRLKDQGSTTIKGYLEHFRYP